MERVIAATVLLALAGACAPAPREELSGAELFINHCSACHGDQGEGDGPVAAVLRVGVPNLRGLSARNGGTFPADDVRAYIDGRSLPVSHGDRAMPVWGNVFQWGEPEDDAEAVERRVQTRIDAIVAFVEQLQR
jgi:mono/diheme cytochrome c family protein